jgi:hypothetical protein
MNDAAAHNVRNRARVKRNEWVSNLMAHMFILILTAMFDGLMISCLNWSVDLWLVVKVPFILGFTWVTFGYIGGIVLGDRLLYFTEHKLPAVVPVKKEV